MAGVFQRNVFQNNVFQVVPPQVIQATAAILAAPEVRTDAKFIKFVQNDTTLWKPPLRVWDDYGFRQKAGRRR